MGNFFGNVMCVMLILLFSSPARAGMSREELQEHQKKLIAREMKKEEARREKMSMAAEALQDNDCDKVIDLTSQILDIYPLDGEAKAEVLVLRARGFLLKGDLVKAKQDSDEALNENRHEQMAYLLRSSIHEKENRKAQAIEDMVAYLRLNPEDQRAQERLIGLRSQISPAKIDTAQQANVAAIPQTALPPLEFFETPDKNYALRKPADWIVKEDSRSDSLRVTVLAPDQTAAVDFLWVRNQTGEINALQALAAYQQRLAPSGSQIVWTDAYRSPNNSKARVTMHYQTNDLSLEGTFYLEASTKALSIQGYMASQGRLGERRPLLYNIMASLALSKTPSPVPPKIATFNPQYIDIPLVGRQAQDGSLTLNTPETWGFVAAQGKVITSAADGSIGFAFLAFSGNPILQGASIAQGIIAQPYMSPAETLPIILSGFGHANITVQNSQADPQANQEFFVQVGRPSDAQDIKARWISNQGAACQGFFKVINAQPSPTGLWFCLLAGIWGPEQEFYRYYPLLENVASSFSINDQFARKYIQDGLRRARELHDQTIAAMQANSSELEKQQIDWEARQQQKDFVDSDWDDYWRGNGYWVSDMENGKVYQTDNSGIKDTGLGDYYEGGNFNLTNFDGRNPRHPSETMQPINHKEMEQILAK